MTKSILRKQMLDRRAALTADEIAACSARIAAQVLLTEAWAEADSVPAYYAVRGEADPAPLVQAAWEAGKRVYLPRVIGKEMIFLPYMPDTELELSRFGIPEPALPDGSSRETEQWTADAGGRTLVLVPGAAFSPDGYRIGYGGGYYDRYFADRDRMPDRFALVGLAYDFQITDETEPEPHDVRLDLVVSESRIYFP